MLSFIVLIFVHWYLCTLATIETNDLVVDVDGEEDEGVQDDVGQEEHPEGEAQSHHHPQLRDRQSLDTVPLIS